MTFREHKVVVSIFVCVGVGYMAVPCRSATAGQVGRLRLAIPIANKVCSADKVGSCSRAKKKYARMVVCEIVLKIFCSGPLNSERAVLNDPVLQRRAESRTDGSGGGRFSRTRGSSLERTHAHAFEQACGVNLLVEISDWAPGRKTKQRQ